MIDFDKPESKEVLLKLGFSESLIEKLVNKQRKGEKVSPYIQFVDLDGRKRVVRIPDSPEEIEERKKRAEERRIRNIRNKTGRNQYSNITLEERFWEKVNRKDFIDCWEWLGALCSDGYGSFLFNGKVEGAHRIAWILTYREIPKDKIIMHKCNNPKCCNPNHLKLGTHKENTKQKLDEGRDADVTGENNPNSKLNWIDINEIRRKHDNLRTKTRVLSIEYNVSEGEIIRIVNNEVWMDSNYKPLHRTGHEGENSSTAKLTWKEVNNIRERYFRYNIKMSQLAEEYNVSENTIHKIIHNKTWVDENYISKLIIEKRDSEIREKYSKGRIRMTDIGKEFNLDRHTVSYIVRNK